MNELADSWKCRPKMFRHLRSAIPKIIKQLYWGWLSQADRTARNHIVELADGRVMSGPFKNMRYTSQSVGSTWAPKLLGTYEQELHDVIAVLIDRQPSIIINIGAAEGCYVVGMLLRCPESHGIAFESTTTGQQLVREMARHNNILDRLDVRGHCDISSLSACLRFQSLSTTLIADIKGGKKTVGSHCNA